MLAAAPAFCTALATLAGAAPSVYEIEELARVYGIDSDILADEPIKLTPGDGVQVLTLRKEFRDISDGVRARIVAAANPARDLSWLRRKLGDGVLPRSHPPLCGSGGLLVKCQLALRECEKEIKRPLRLHGQELTGSAYAIARMNMVIHDMEGEIARGNSMTNPKFLEGAKLRQFDIVVTNPMWNQDNFDPDAYEKDRFDRFTDRKRIIKIRGHRVIVDADLAVLYDVSTKGLNQ